ncbi:DNA-binding transcriptional activator of the SARP family [Actinokineospora iranica]|uniref:DNA-binding transcriptional activator of the SARP family n=1 Tax=Actinokineospora iranica TaxID=1271860 RepID=A0A1G6SPI1_9PSEU|nr:DNA-binding transcriptional activator of the SARP family [Actinokineospora iranica]
MLTYRILGPIEIQAGGEPVEISGTFQRTLLAALLVNHDRLVLTESLIGELWEHNPPRNAENALQAHISRLRRRLRGVDPARKSPRFLSMPSGYRLCLNGDAFDADVFTHALLDVRANPSNNPLEMIGKLRTALTLWRGPTFGGTLGGFICQAAAVRYKEYRAAALERLYEAELMIGRHNEIVAELSELVESESLNERLCQQLMVALYRCGRQRDALAVYQRMRARLMDELGVEPSPVLQKCQMAILAHDAVLQPRPAPVPSLT